MARNVRIIQIEPTDVSRLERLCTLPDPELTPDSIIFERSTDFDEDRTISVQVISSKKPAKEPCWTQAVLFQKGIANELIELACTPPGSAAMGEYRMQVGGDEYTVDVVVDKNVDF